MSRGAYARGKKALGICDRCGFTYKLDKLKTETVNLSRTNLRVCPVCWDPDHPQNWQGRIDYSDPEALRDPRPDSVDGSATGDRWLTSTGSEFPTDTDGWAPNSGTAGITWTSDNSLGSVYPTVGASGDGIGRFVTGTPVSIDTTVYNKVRIKVRSITEADSGLWLGQFKWTTDTDGTFNAAKTVTAARPTFEQMGDQWHIITWDLKDDGDWIGTCIGVQVILNSSVGDATEIEYVRFESR